MIGQNPFLEHPLINDKKMKLAVTHEIAYMYSGEVFLTPHQLYLTPKVSPYQELLSHQLIILPSPDLLVRNVDAESNIQHIAYINRPCDSFVLKSELVIETNKFNPFDFVYFPFEASRLPFAYPEKVKILLQPYLSQENITTHIHQTAREMASFTNWNTTDFLTYLCETIHKTMWYEAREEGNAFLPEQVLIQKRGSCRDFVVLMIALCKSIGIAARFVSGYCYGSERHAHELHAWVEVYLPGGGWRGFDPTEGKAIDANYIALATSAQPEQINPTTGTFSSKVPVNSTLKASVVIKQH